MFFYLIRHGDPDYENDSLTERGFREAEAVGERLSHEGITEIYSSPMGRAQRTAAPLARRLGLPVGIEDWAHELDLMLEGEQFTKRLCVNVPTFLLRSDEMRALGAEWYRHPLFEKTDAKEQIGVVERGADAFFERLGLRREGGLYRRVPGADGKNADERTVALFCHGGMGLTLLARLLDVPAPQMWANGYADTTGVTKLWFQEYGDEPLTSPRVIYQNDTRHLMGGDQ